MVKDLPEICTICGDTGIVLDAFSDSSYLCICKKTYENEEIGENLFEREKVSDMPPAIYA